MDTEIRAYFNSFTKDELSTILVYYEREFSKKARKAELVDMVSEFIGGNPHDWLYRLPERDLRLLRHIIDGGPDNWVTMDSPEYPSLAAVLGLIYVDDNSFDDIMVSIDFSLFFTVSSIIDQVINEKEFDGSFETERTALGILNIYGAVSAEFFVRTIFDMFEDENTASDFMTDLVRCPIISMNRALYKDDVYLISPYAYDYESIIDEREGFNEITGYKSYLKQDAIEAGAGCPYCAFKTFEYSEAVDMLKTIGYSDGEAKEEMHKIWLNSQHASSDSAAEAIFSSVNSRIDEIESFDLYRKYIDIIAAYANSVPKWLLKGESADDAGMLKLSIKVDDFLMDEDAEEEEPGPLKEFYKYNMAVRHVGPDDPCPCGSGLSYCRCHGKRLN